MSVLITGASGTVGSRVAVALEDVDIRRAMRRPLTSGDVEFDFTRPRTWSDAFTGVSTMLVVRPPALGNVRRDLLPALQYGREHGVERFVLISVQGAESLPMLPHAAIERWIRDSGAAWTFLRPAYFHQNLTTTLAPDVSRGHLLLPSGGSRMAFVDADDVAAVAAAVLRDPRRFDGTALTLTGGECPRWSDVAALLTAVLGRRVTYRSVGALTWLRHARQELGMDIPMAVVTGAIHASARLGRSGQLTSTVPEVLGRKPVTLRSFVERERSAWL